MTRERECHQCILYDVVTVALRPGQHMHIRQSAILITLVAGLAAAGCGGSSPVKPQSSASYREAEHLDTLATRAATAGQYDRYRLLAYPIAALLENVTPSTVTLSVDGANQTYQAVVLELVGTTAGANPMPSDSVYVVVAWSDSNADELVYTQVALPDTLEDVADLTDTVPNFAIDSAPVLSVAMSGASGKCHAFSPALANAAVADFLNGTTCATGAATAAFTFYFTPDASNPHTVFTLASQSINAVRFVLPANTGGQEKPGYKKPT
jgi:hypothetical protein